MTDSIDEAKDREAAKTWLRGPGAGMIDKAQWGIFIDGWLARARTPRGEARPEVVCLCGSTRFIETFQSEYGRLTDEGKIVLSVGRVVPQSEQALGSERKALLDVLHLRKIDLADRVLVLNVGGYVGPSTRREIAYAKECGKPIDLLYPDAGLDGLPPPVAPEACPVAEKCALCGGGRDSPLKVDALQPGMKPQLTAYVVPCPAVFHATPASAAGREGAVATSAVAQPWPLVDLKALAAMVHPASIHVRPNDFLPPRTMIVSPDLAEAFKAAFPQAEAEGGGE